LFQLATKPPKTAQFEPAPLSPCPQPTEQADREESNCCRHHNINAVEGRILKVRASLIEELIPDYEPDDFTYGEEPRLEVCQEPLLHHFSSSFSVWTSTDRRALARLSSLSWSKTFQVSGQVRERTGPALIHNQLVDRSLQTNVCDETVCYEIQLSRL
jgi:hypothetical protein